MTTTLSPPKETTTHQVTTTVVTTPTQLRSLPNWLRRVRDFWKSVPDEARLDSIQLQRELFLSRQQVK